MAENLADLSEKDVFFKVLRDSVSNTFWFGLGAGVIWLLGGFSWWIGVVLFVIYALVTVADALMVLITSLLPSFITVPMAIRSSFAGERAALGKESFMIAALVVRLLEATIGIVLGIFLYRFFF